jgi:hypothetical protein
MLPGAMKVTLPDGSGLDLPAGASGLDAAAAIGDRLAQAAVAVEVDGELRDVRLPLHDGDRLRILTDRDPEALGVLRHSTAHVMAQAVLHLWPEAKIAIGPAIADGFYYDFEFPQPIGPDDLDRIEAEMRKILKHKAAFVREDDVEKAGLLDRFRAEHQPYKLELAEGLPDGDSASTATTTSRICAGGRTCRRPRRSRRSSCCPRRARTGAAITPGRCSRASTAPPSSSRPTSTSICIGSRRRAGATTAASAASSTCSTPLTSHPAGRSGTRAGW